MPSCSHNIKPRCLIRSSNSCKYTIPTYHLRTSMQDTLRIAFLAMRCNVHSIGIASQQGITMTLHCVRFPCNAQHSIAVNELSCPQMPLHCTTCKAFHCICTFHCPWQHYRTWHDKGSHYSALQCMIFHCTVMGTPTVYVVLITVSLPHFALHPAYKTSHGITPHHAVLHYVARATCGKCPQLQARSH